MLKLLEVYNYDKKARLGVDCDGGYVFGMLDGTYDCYISCGVSREESFSRDFIAKYSMKSTNSFAFDGTIRLYPYHYTEDITFIKKNITNFNDSKHTDLSFLTDVYSNIFMKMDIEGGEYAFLLGIREETLKKFKQIVIEVHGINDDSYGCVFSDKVKCLEKLSNTHCLIHAHGNNNAPITNNIPDVIELTYINKNCVTDIPSFNKTPLPIPNVDFPNNKDRKDYELNFYPFVSRI